MNAKALLTGLAMSIAGPSAAIELPAGAQLQAQVSSPAERYPLPIAGWAEGVLPVRQTEGAVTWQAWRIAETAQTSLQLLQALRDQVVAAGYQPIFECQTQGCGGFDFRFATPVLPPPGMQVDLGDFHFLSAQMSGDGGSGALSLLVSRVGGAGFVQIITVAADDLPAAGAPMPAIAAQAGLASDLQAHGRAVLADLDFASGAMALAPGRYQSLGALAAYLAQDSARRVVLVGHTDARGDLATNITLSRARARAVQAALIAEYGVAQRQLAADGIGYLAPLAPNDTAAGRAANRRVEVVLTAP